MNARGTAKRSKAIKLAAKEADVMFSRVQRAQPLMTAWQLKLAIAGWRSDLNGRTRELALAVLTQPGETVLKQISEDRELAIAAVELLDRLREYRGRLQKFAALVDEAELRLRVALTRRRDLQAVIHEARGND